MVKRVSYAFYDFLVDEPEEAACSEEHLVPEFSMSDVGCKRTDAWQLLTMPAQCSSSGWC